jgi:hypothetical protein
MHESVPIKPLPVGDPHDMLDEWFGPNLKTHTSGCAKKGFTLYGKLFFIHCGFHMVNSEAARC